MEPITNIKQLLKWITLIVTPWLMVGLAGAAFYACDNKANAASTANNQNSEIDILYGNGRGSANIHVIRDEKRHVTCYVIPGTGSGISCVADKKQP